MIYKNKKTGFTLIEIAIVLSIIAFIVASVIATRRLIEKSNIDSIIGDIKKFSSAVEQFENKYGGLPGDLANISSLPQGTNLLAGNGNGVIDTSTEALQFWYHLKLAGLVSGNFNGTSTYIPATSTTPGGIAAANSFQNAGFSVLSNNSSLINNLSFTGKIVFNISYFPSINYQTSIFTPAQAQYLDTQLDDGNPNTGNFRATDGTAVNTGDCVTGNSYNLNNTNTVCYTQFILSSYQPVSNVSNNVCLNGIFGSNTYSAPCPPGYKGYISRHCDGNGNMVVAENLCEPVKCNSTTTVGDTITTPCPVGYAGNILLTCSITGVFRIDSSNCTLPPNSGCSSPAYSSATINSCPIDKYGFKQIYNCDNSNTLILGGGCEQDVGCNVSTVFFRPGVISPVAQVTTCPANYTFIATNANQNETCLLNGNVRITKSNCMPNFGTCTPGNTRSLGCPMSQTGTYTQKCNASGYWETDVNTCVSVTCGGEPIGAFRIAKNLACPPGQKGNIYEVCDYRDSNYNSATWQPTSINCTQ